MPTTFVAPANVGTGDGSSAGNAKSYTSALAAAAGGDVLKFTTGNYGNLPAPTNNGTPTTNITLDGTGFSPVFEGGTLLTGWSGVTLAYSAAGGNIYRTNWNVAQVGGCIWANDFTGSGALGRNCA